MQTKQDIDRSLDSIQQLVRSKKLESAAVELEQMLNHDTVKCFALHVDLRERLRDVLIEVSEAYVDAGAIDAARRNLLLISEKLRVQDNGMIAYNLARCEFLSGNFNGGVQIIEKSINDVEDGMAVVMYQILGEQALRVGKYEKALETYETAIRRFDGVEYADDVKGDMNEIVAALFASASEAALGTGDSKKSQHFLDILDGRPNVPDWVQEFTANARAGKIGLRSDPLYWRK